MEIRLIISILITLNLTYTSLEVKGQFFSSAQTPLSVRWRQINSGQFKIIFPAEIEKDAQYLATLIPYTYPTISEDMKASKTSFPIVLHNQGTTSNGFVQLAPKKSEFYTISPQKFDNQNWLNNLAIHELRHVAQYNKYTLKRRFIFPEELYFGYLGISTPIWYLEGDAVNTETLHSYSGRGRQPEWLMNFRTTLLSDQKLSYSKAYFGSNKTTTPGYYQLGYLMTAILREKYGAQIFDDLTTEILRQPIKTYPFSKALKKLTKHNTKQYFEQVKTMLKSDWDKQADLTPHHPYETINKQAKFATDFELPVHLKNGNLLALKSSKKEAPFFVVIDSNKNEQKITKIGQQESPWFSHANGKIIWDETREDARYKQRSWNVICMYDLQTKNKTQLTHKTRLFSPQFSGDGKKIIAINITLSNEHQLVLIDPKNGKITDTLVSTNSEQLQTPALNFNGQIATWISVTEAGKSLWLSKNGSHKKLISDSRQQIHKPIFKDDKIVFNAHFNGINNVYSVDTGSLKIYAHTQAKFGAFNANFDHTDSLIYFNNYSFEGLQISKAKLENLAIGDNNFVNYSPATSANDYIFNTIPDSTFTSTPYKAALRIFNFHSLSPTITDDANRIGLELKSDDLLNTTNTYLGATYDGGLRKMQYYAGIRYKALYPIFSVNYSNRPRLANYSYQRQMHQASWREDYTSLTASIPLSFSAYNHHFGFLAETGTYYVNRHLNTTDAARIANHIAFPLSYRLSFSHQIRKAERDIAPRWAQLVQFKLQNQGFDKRISGKLVAVNSYFYFPGVLPNHGFLTSFNFQQNNGSFRTLNAIEQVYGYNQIKALETLKNSLLFNYRFPFLFPDIEVGPLAYIKSISASIFSHYENVDKNLKLAQPKTYGFEFRSNMHLLRYQPVANIGTRFIFVNKIYNQKPIFELLFNYNF